MEKVENSCPCGALYATDEYFANRNKGARVVARLRAVAHEGSDRSPCLHIKVAIKLDSIMKYILSVKYKLFQGLKTYVLCG